MKLRARNGFLVLLAAALVVVLAGCPNSTSITAGIGTTQLEINVVNPSRFDVGFFNIDRLLVRPIDPGASQAIGNARDFSLLPFGAFIDTNVAMVDPLFLDATQLSQGVYEVIEIRLSSLFFFDTTSTDPSICNFYEVPPPAITVRNFGVPPQFTVIDAQETMFALTFDMTQMIATLDNAFSCLPGCFGFCTTNFDAAQFTADTLDYLTFL